MTAKGQYKTDREDYNGKDSGCQHATDYQGSQSSCRHCPFPKCVFDEPRLGVARARTKNRNEEIIQRWRKGESISDSAIAFGVSQRTIQRIVKRRVADG